MIKNILVDECLSPQAAVAIRAFAAISRDVTLNVKHLVADLGYGSTEDPKWMAKLRPASEWLVVTSDRGRHGNDTPLPHVARSLNLPVLVLYGKLGMRPMVDRTRAVLVMWPDIERVVFPTGAKRSWRILCRGKHSLKLEEMVRPDRQGELFARFSTVVKDKRMERG